MNDLCRAFSSPVFRSFNPSMVTTLFLSHSMVRVIHDSIGSPSIRTVQLQQPPWSQAILVPVKPSVSLRVCASVSEGLISLPSVSSCSLPFTVRRRVLNLTALSRVGDTRCLPVFPVLLCSLSIPTIIVHLLFSRLLIIALLTRVLAISTL